MLRSIYKAFQCCLFSPWEHNPKHFNFGCRKITEKLRFILIKDLSIFVLITFTIIFSEIIVTKVKLFGFQIFNL